MICGNGNRVAGAMIGTGNGRFRPNIKKTGTLDSVRPVLGKTMDVAAGILPLRPAAAA